MDDANNRIVRMYSYALTESGSMTRVNMTDADFADIASLPHVEDISVKYVLRGEVTSVSYSGREVRPPYEYVCTDAAYSAFTGAETEALTGGGEYIVAGRDFAAGDELVRARRRDRRFPLGIDAAGGDFGSLTVSLRSSVTGEEKTVTLDIVGIYDGRAVRPVRLRRIRISPGQRGGLRLAALRVHVRRGGSGASRFARDVRAIRSRGWTKS